MSKEMMVILLGVWTIVVTQLGIPGSWKMLVLALTGAAIATVGFLLRGETLARNSGGSRSSSFVESAFQPHKKQSVPITPPHEKDGINSLN